MSVQRPFSVRLFLPGGDPQGLKTIEKSNWSGAGLVVPRTLLGEAKARPEWPRPGAYLLVGPDESSQLDRVYVGEADPIGDRLEQHAKAKDFWTHAVAFVSKDQNLHKAHVQHLESRLIGLAKEAKRCVLDNGNTPLLPSLSESDRAEVESFLADILLCLPVLGFRYFEVAPAPKPTAQELFLAAKGIQARGYEASDGFVVRKGSGAVKEEVTSIPAYLVDLRRSLLEQEVIVDRGGALELLQDYVFASPSTAAGVLLGRNANGRIEWKTEDGRVLKAVQEAEGVD